MTPSPRPPARAELEARIKALEAILKCVNCGHLRNEHEEDDTPCYGGRTPEMLPGEGDYCDCRGFVSEESV